MQCELCKKNLATCQLMEIVANKKKTVCLCNGCAKGYSFKNHDKYLEKYEQISEGQGTMTCPVCRTKLSDLLSNREFGCEFCFEYFADFLDRMLGGKVNIGKAPVLKRVHVIGSTSINQLNREIQEAVDAEDFERAAELKHRRDSLF